MFDAIHGPIILDLQRGAALYRIGEAEKNERNERCGCARMEGEIRTANMSRELEFGTSSSVSLHVGNSCTRTRIETILCVMSRFLWAESR
jgi:hypothetical protein